MRWFDPSTHTSCLFQPLLGDGQPLPFISVLCLALLAALVAGFAVGFVLRRLSDGGEDQT